MLLYTTHGEGGPLIVMLHWLGGSAKTWTEVSEALALRGMSCAALDLPGFGREIDAPAITVAASVEAIIVTIQSLRAGRGGPWLLAGHSMGGKFAAIIARAALDGRDGLEDLRGVVLVSPSPPGAEPMTESTRQKMLDSLGQSTQDATRDRQRAESFVDDNTGKLPLLGSVRSRAVDDVLRMSRSAFVSWLTIGSREDWASRVGSVSLPALLLAGTEEPALGPPAQRLHTMPHFPSAVLVPLQGGGHLAPLERPAELADRIITFVQSLGLKLERPSLRAGFSDLIDSDRTSQQTRTVLLERLEEDRAAVTGGLSEDELLTLRAVSARVLPGSPFDLASRVDRRLSSSEQDGWRFDSLPPDGEAWHRGLASLHASALQEHGVPFIALDAVRQDVLLRKAAEGKLGKTLLGSLHVGDAALHFTAAQMRDWFSDLCAELTRLYVSDPRTMDRIGFTGFADEHGFSQIRLNQREDFER